MGSSDRVTINARIRIPAVITETVVKNAKQVAGADEKGVYRVDTAEKLNELIGHFLETGDFAGYVSDIRNYK
jgi:hypothetical protein